MGTAAEVKRVKEILERPFPKEQIKTRKGSWDSEKGDYAQYTYVESDNIIARLREAFGLSFGVRIIGTGKPEDYITTNSKSERNVVVMVELDYIDPATSTKMSVLGVGNKKITSEIGNDFKSAKSKAIANAAKIIGVAADLDSDASDLDETTEAPQGVKAQGVTVNTGVGVTPSTKDKEETPTSQGVGVEVKGKGKGNTKTEQVSGLVPPESLPSNKASEEKESTTTTKKVTIELGSPAKDETPPEQSSVVPESKEKPAQTQVQLGGSEPKAEENGHSAIHCEICNQEIVAAVTSDGVTMSPQDIINISKAIMKKQACSRCMKVYKQQKAEEKNKAS